MKYEPIIVKLKKPRDPYAVSAMGRRASKMKDRREDRGGAKNWQREFSKEE